MVGEVPEKPDTNTTLLTPFALLAVALHFLKLAFRFLKQLWPHQAIDSSCRQGLGHPQREPMRFFCPRRTFEIRGVRAAELLAVFIFASDPEVGLSKSLSQLFAR